MKNKTPMNIELYNCAYNFLVRISPVDNVDRYLDVDKTKYETITDLYRRLIFGAQNYQRMPNVIQFNNREKSIARILHNYDLDYISSCNEESLFEEFRTEFGFKTPFSKNNLWYKWTCAAIDSARFMKRFNSVEEFDKLVKDYSADIDRKIELPRYIASQIRGIGFALACDYLKEIGYLDYTKSDVHLKDVFETLGLSSRDDIELFRAVTQMAEDNNISPYKVDKVFWLICSGNYSKDGMNTALL